MRLKGATCYLHSQWVTLYGQFEICFSTFWLRLLRDLYITSFGPITSQDHTLAHVMHVTGCDNKQKINNTKIPIDEIVICMSMSLCEYVVKNINPNNCCLHAYVCMCVCDAYAYVCMCVHMYVCVHVCACVCMCVWQFYKKVYGHFTTPHDCPFTMHVNCLIFIQAGLGLVFEFWIFFLMLEGLPIMRCWVCAY